MARRRDRRAPRASSCTRCSASSSASSLHAERIAREALATPQVESPLGLPVAHCILGIALYFRGELEEAEPSLDEAAGSRSPAATRSRGSTRSATSA